MIHPKRNIGWKGLILICILGIGLSAVAKDTTDFMSLSLEEILNMEVTTASKSGETQSDAPGIISVLTGEELARFGGTTLRDILERVPGLIATGQNVTNRTIIASRQLQLKDNSAQILLLINGRPVREIQEGGVSSEMFETFPIQIIDRIEVVKGPGSVLYGSDAFLGVINVITKKAERTGVTVTQMAGDGSSLISSGSLTVRKGNLGIVAAGRYMKKADWKTDYLYMNTPTGPTGGEAVPTLASVARTIVNRGPGAYLGITYKGLSVMTGYNEWKTAYFQAGTIGDNTLTKSYTNLGYTHAVRDNWDVDVNVIYTYATLHAPVITKRWSHNLVAELTNSLTLGEKTKLIVGGLLNQNEGRERSYGTQADTIYTPGSIISKGENNSAALYAQVDYRLLDNLKLIGGMQAIKPEDIDLTFVPRAGIIWQPAERFAVKALYSQAFRTPSINETHLNFMDILVGNPNLNPEKVFMFDLGMSYQGEQTQIGLSLFSSKLTDIIVPMSTGGWSRQYKNAGKAVFSGVELEGKYFVNRSLYFTGSAIYAEHKDTDDDDNPEFSAVSDYGAKAGVSYVWNKGITVGLFDIYQGDLDDGLTQNINPYQGAYNLLHLNGTFDLNRLLGLHVGKDFSFLVQVDNLLDKPHFGYDIGGTSGDAIPNIPGRAIYAGLSVTM